MAYVYIIAIVLIIYGAFSFASWMMEPDEMIGIDDHD